VCASGSGREFDPAVVGFIILYLPKVSVGPVDPGWCAGRRLDLQRLASELALLRVWGAGILSGRVCVGVRWQGRGRLTGSSL